MADLYSRLGVSRTATVDEIRRAYKDSARSKHPDKGGDPEEFKAIQEAHEVLCDEERRRMYDMTGSVSNGGDGGMGGGMAAGGIPFHFMGGMGPFGMPGVGFDMGEMFGNIFGGGGMGGVAGPRRQQRRGGKGPNKHHDIGLRLAEFYKGHEIKIKFNQARRCTGCNGTGAESTEPCGPCNGLGFKTTMRQIGPGMMAQTRSPCDNCNGEGTRIMRTCKTCQGKKFTEREKQFDIRIIPGMVEGEQLIYNGECSDTPEYDSPGDIVLTLRRADNSDAEIDHYEWRGSDLWIRKSITYAESILGFKRKFEDHPNGSSPTFVWRGGPIIHGAVLQMPEMGMPKRGGGFGNLFIMVMVTPPPTVPWSSEDAAKLASVLGTSATVFDEPETQTLFISSSDSKLIVNKNP